MGTGTRKRNRRIKKRKPAVYTVPGDYNKRDPERENWPRRVMLPILPIQSISGSRLLQSPGICICVRTLNFARIFSSSFTSKCSPHAWIARRHKAIQPLLIDIPHDLRIRSLARTQQMLNAKVNKADGRPNMCFIRPSHYAQLCLMKDHVMQVHNVSQYPSARALSSY